MTSSFPRHALHAFFFTALIYLAVVSFISYPLTTFLKPIAILCLIIGVWQSNIVQWAKMTLMVGLSFSLIGDIILTIPMAHQIELGIVCFLLTHCCYIALFLKRYTYNLNTVLSFLPVIVYAALIFKVIYPHAGAMLIPVCIYFGILLTMVFTAFQVNMQKMITAAGALCFLASDTLLAMNLFVLQANDLTLPVMITYYAAQVMITLGVVGLYQSEQG